MMFFAARLPSSSSSSSSSSNSRMLLQRIRRPVLLCSLLLLFLVSSFSMCAAAVAADNNAAVEEETATTTTYGMDVSFPIQRPVSTNYPWLAHNIKGKDNTPTKYQNMPLQVLGDRQSIYLEHLQGCRNYYPHEANLCDHFEYHRILMNLRQPMSMKNYTKSGFLKTKVPDDVWKQITKFWNFNSFKGVVEEWTAGNVYINHWVSPTYHVSVDDTKLRGSGFGLKQNIWSASTKLLEAWANQELQPVSMYGIRVYGEGAVMLPHVDRLPLVVSAAICVHSDLDEPWPFELYHHETGMATNVTLEEGEMLLFETHSVIHGHPFPLKGRSYGLLFIHFEPTGTALVNGDDTTTATTGGGGTTPKLDKVYENYKQAAASKQAGPGHENSLPPYIQEDSPEVENWRQYNPDGWKPPSKIVPHNAHVLAQSGQLEELRQQLEQDKKQMLRSYDDRGWQVLHSSVESGEQKVVEFLVQSGAEMNARTIDQGETPLRIAERQLGHQHPVTVYLRSLGALSLGPEL